MARKKFRIVAFDCDGVMFDTKKANDEYYNSILKHVKLPPMTPEQSAYVHMHTVEESIAHIVPDSDLRNIANEHRQKMGYLPFMELMVIEPNLKPLLEKIRPAFATAIATNRTNTIGRVLQDHGLEAYFDIVVSARDVEHPKPHPDQLQKILTHFDADGSQMLYVGDSQVDELAAKAAEVIFASYDNPQLTADYHIKSLKELEAILGL